MKPKNILLIALLVILLGCVVFAVEKRKEVELVIPEDTQGPHGDDVIEFVDPVAVAEWEKRRDECQKKDVGIKIESISGLMDPETVRIDAGETGCVFTGRLSLSTGARIQFMATTKDYSISKDGLGFGTEGYVTDGNTFHILRWGEPIEQPFVPDEIWQLDGGRRALVKYGTNFETTLDYPDVPVSVLINIPQAGFSGIGFGLFYPESTPHPASVEDIAVLKKVVTSIVFQM